jgi:hypothetical protein
MRHVEVAHVFAPPTGAHETVAAAEVGVGLALVLLIYRNRTSINLDDLDLMKG